MQAAFDHKQASMQAVFDQKLAEVTKCHDVAGDGRAELKDERFDRDLFDEKHFRFCDKFGGVVADWDE